MGLKSTSGEPCVLLYGGCFVPFYATIELFLRANRIRFKVISDRELISFQFQPNHRLFIFPSGHYFDDTPKYAFGGKHGIKNLKNAIASGMNYLGICAGAFAGLKKSYYPIDISLDLVDANHRWPYETGVGAQFFSIKISREFMQAAGLDNDILRAWYHNGPIISMNNRTNFKVLATFSPTSEERRIAKNGFLYRKHLAHAPAIVESYYGAGRVILCTPHLELGDLGIREYQAYLRQWLSDNGYENCSFDLDTPAYKLFMNDLGGDLMQPIRYSNNWKLLSAIINSLL